MSCDVLVRLSSFAIETVLPLSAQPDRGAASLRTLSRATLRHYPSPSTNFALSHCLLHYQVQRPTSQSMVTFRVNSHIMLNCHDMS